MGFGSLKDISMLEGSDPASQMLGSGKGDTPEAPDFNKIARTQGRENRKTQLQQARLNNANEYNPFGEKTVTWKNGRATINSSLSPYLQSRLNDVQSRFSSDFDMSGLPQAPDLQNNQSRDAMVNALMGRAQPFMDRNRDRRETQLANQGIMQGSDAYKSAMDDLSRSENDFLLGAQQQAGDEQAREYGLMSQARENALNEALMSRKLPFSELQSIMGLASPNAGIQGVGGAQGADLYGAGQDQYSAMMGKYNANQARNANMMSGLMGLGSAFLMSDRRSKKNITPVGMTESGLTIYEFTYKDSDVFHYGFMADEVKVIFPDAVIRDENGFDRVDYSQTDYPRIH